MAVDLHQRGPARLRACLLLWSAAGAALLVVLGLSSPHDVARGQDAGAELAVPLEGPRPCRIDGRASFQGLRVIATSRHAHSRVATMDLAAREVSVEAITPTLFRVRTRTGEPAVEGEARVPPPITLRRELALPGLTVLRGTPVVRLTPREAALDVDLDLGSGVRATRVVLGCDSLRVRAPEAPTHSLAEPPPASPRWASRGLTLAIRARPEEGIETTRLTAPPTLVLHEVGRTEAYVHVEAPLARGRIDGWVRDATLVPAR